MFGEIFESKKNNKISPKEWEFNLGLLKDHLEHYCFMFLNRDGKIVSFNKKALRLFGYKPEELKGSDFSILYPEEKRSKGTPQKELNQAFKNGIFESEDWKSRKNQPAIWTRMVITPALTKKGKLEGFVVSIKECLKYEQTKKKIQVASDELETRIRIINALLQTFDIQERLKVILNEILSLLRVEIGAIYLKEANRVLIKFWKNIPKKFLGEISEFSFDSVPDWLRNPTIFSSSDMNMKSINFPMIAYKEGIKSFASIPLVIPEKRRKKGKWIGAITIGSKKQKSFTIEKVKILESLAPQIALAIEHSLSYKMALRRLQRLEALREIDKEIIRRLTIQEIVETLHKFLPADFEIEVVVLILNIKRKPMTFLSSLSKMGRIEEKTLHLVNTLHKKVAELQGSLKTSEIAKEYRGTTEKATRLTPYLSIPLRMERETIGVLHFITKRPKFFSKEDIDFLHTLGNQVAIALRSAKVIEELRESEERFRIMATSAQDAIIMLDNEGKVTFWNRAAEVIFGYSEKEIVGKNFHEIVLKKTQAKLATNAYKRFQESGKGSIIGKLIEMQVVGKSGKEIPVELSISGMKTKGKWHSIAIIRDIRERKKYEEQLKLSLEKFHTSLKQIIYVLGNTLEFRDPYTSSHQRKVAELAHAIASEMHLPKFQIEGITLAGLIHDIGKISVPSEILVKPSRLTSTEFALIKEHPEVAHKILKNVDFPWPIADMILQHHERMDGSGYPIGLRGDQILKEARILAVSDVVEAMASHRPYRPALGLEKAFEEISAHRGTLYDAEVVDACLRVFNERNFKFSD